MRSALYIGLKQNIPLTKTQIPSCGSPNGMPFCFEYSGAVTQWQLVKEGEDYGYDLDVSWLTNDGKYIYYNGDIDLLAYLTGLGYDARAGRYYYSFRLDGVDLNELSLTDSYNRASTPQTVAYGSYKFTILFDNQFTIHLINSSATTDSDNYFIQFDKFGGIWFASGSTTLFRVSDGYLTAGNEYDIEVVRSVLGEFSVYVDAVLPTPSTGTNPITDNTITTSSYMYLESYFGGSKLINPSVNDIPIDVSTFTELEGTIIADTSSTGGTIKQSNLFQLECEDLRPVTPGDFNNDFNNDFF